MVSIPFLFYFINNLALAGELKILVISSDIWFCKYIQYRYVEDCEKVKQVYSLS